MICLLDESANKGQSDALASRKPALTYRDAIGDLTARPSAVIKTSGVSAAAGET